jgi:hypothetical protein
LTIRQYLERRSGIYARGTCAFLLLAGALVTSAPKIFVIRFTFAVLIGAVVLAAFWSLFHIPCPKCAKPMGSTGFWTAIGRRVAPAQCPHCNVNLDVEAPGSPER